VNVAFGYAFTEANDARNNGSSTATSSFDVTAAFNLQAPEVSTSLTQTRHNFTFALNWKEQFFDEYDTSLGIFFSARSGRPYSLTFNNGGVFADSQSGNDNALLYVPTGPGDPNVVYRDTTAADLNPTLTTGRNVVVQTAAQAEQNLLGFVAASGCDFTPGQTIERNSCKNDWVFDLDMRFSQEIPGPGRLFGLEDKIELFADFDNFLNFIDADWNVFRRRGGSAGLVSVADALPVDNQGRYVIRNVNVDNQNVTGFSSSVWRIQLGVRYEF
jgi:hypothetical protein